jgi:V/A-type H+-transporting ATPase subunit F
MKNSSEMAVIGDKDTVLAFKALGVEAFYETERRAIIATLRQLVEKDYRIVFITEREAEKVNDYIESRAGIAFPIILPIPDGVNSYGYGNKRINANIERAIGGTLGGIK